MRKLLRVLGSKSSTNTAINVTTTEEDSTTPYDSTSSINNNINNELDKQTEKEEVLGNGMSWPVGRAGHCVTSDNGKTLAFMFGGYSASHSPDAYFGDLWCFPLQPPGFPSLLRICACIVRKHYDVKSLVLPEELRQLLSSDPSIQREQTWRKLYGVSLPGKRTTSGSAFLNNKLWLFGGSEGSPTNNDIFYFDLETFEWKLVEALGSKPRMSNYVTLIPLGNKLFTLFPPSYSIFDPETNTWEEFSSTTEVGTPTSSPDSMVATLWEGKVYCFGGEKNHIYILNLQTQQWSRIILDTPGGEFIASDYGAACFCESRLYRFHPKQLLAYDFASYEENSSNKQYWTVLDYGGDTLRIGSSGTMASGSPTRVFLFGGYSPQGIGGYSNETYIVDIAPDLSSAKVTDMKHVISLLS